MPPFIRGVNFSHARRRLRLVGWEDAGQEGSHLHLTHLYVPDVVLALPDHRNRDLDPRTLGSVIQEAGLTAGQFAGLTGSGHQRIRREVYGMDE